MKRYHQHIYSEGQGGMGSDSTPSSPVDHSRILWIQRWFQASLNCYELWTILTHRPFMIYMARGKQIHEIQISHDHNYKIIQCTHNELVSIKTKLNHDEHFTEHNMTQYLQYFTWSRDDSHDIPEIHMNLMTTHWNIFFGLFPFLLKYPFTAHNLWSLSTTHSPPMISSNLLNHSNWFPMTYKPSSILLSPFPQHPWTFDSWHSCIYSDSKNPFHTNPKCGVRSAPPYSMGIPLSFGGVIHSIYPWLQDCSLGHVIWCWYIGWNNK